MRRKAKPPAEALTTQQAIEGLRLVAEALDALWRDQPDDVGASLFVFGGVAIAVRLGQVWDHKDVDVTTGPRLEPWLDDAARTVGASMRLPADWLDTAGRTFLARAERDRNPTTIARSERVTVEVASVEFLIAMKMWDCRPGKDERELLLLCEQVGLKSHLEARLMYRSYFGRASWPISPRAEAVVATFFQPPRQQNRLIATKRAAPFQQPASERTQPHSDGPSLGQ